MNANTEPKAAAPTKPTASKKNHGKTDGKSKPAAPDRERKLLELLVNGWAAEVRATADALSGDLDLTAARRRLQRVVDGLREAAKVRA